MSNIADGCFLGPRRTLAAYGPLIKSSSDNSHAALITLFVHASDITYRMVGRHFDGATLAHEFTKFMEYTGCATCDPSDPYSMSFSGFLSAHDLLRDYDEFFDSYMNDVDLSACAEAAGVNMREHNAIVEAWPNKLKKKPGESGAKKEFQDLWASSASGAERYVEWVRKT